MISNKNLLLEKYEGQTAAPLAHIPAVDGLRAIAALTVVFYHLFTNAGNPEFRPWFHVNLLRPMHDGFAGVNLFLVLSGFCLYWPLARKPALRLQYGNFMLRRAWRIVPAYYASLLVVPFGFWAMRATGWGQMPRCLPNGAWDVALHALLLHSLDPRTIFSWHGITWSLGLEWTWYLFFPVAVWMFRCFGAWRALFTLAAMTFVYRCGMQQIFGHFFRSSPANLDIQTTLRFFLVARLFEFALGMWVAWWLANRRISPAFSNFALFLVIGLLIGARFAEAFDVMLPWRDAIFGLAFAAMLMAVVSPHRNPIQQLCGIKPLRWVGECSYSLYLLHMLAVGFFAVLLGRLGFHGARLFFVSLPIVFPAVLLARAGYLLTEKPFMNFGKRKDSILVTRGVPKISSLIPAVAVP